MKKSYHSRQQSVDGLVVTRLTVPSVLEAVLPEGSHFVTLNGSAVDIRIPTQVPEVEMLGKSPEIQKVIELISKISRYEAPVLIEGETGTGKDVVSRSIHYGGVRYDKPFIPVNCGAIPDTLFESQLFEHIKGAFTDAKHDHPGIVGLAGDGTIFLDEIESLSLKGQVTLLRFLQDGCYRNVGGTSEIRSNVRVISASNMDLSKFVETGKFRRDLFYRLKVLYLHLPPLRERPGDVRILAKHFVRHYADRLGNRSKTFHPDTFSWMERYIL